MSADAAPRVANGKYAGCERVLVDGTMTRKLSERELAKFRARMLQFPWVLPLPRT